MLNKTKPHPEEKQGLHPRNKHRGRYDFEQLCAGSPGLAPFVNLNIHNDESIDFADPGAVKALNKALLKHYYGIGSWDIPLGYLCPPVPGRADYIHYIADLLGSSNKGKIPEGDKIKCLDIGTGANCIYPIIGSGEYGWSFTGADIDPVAIQSATKIIELNPSLTGRIELRLQNNPGDIFFGIIRQDELFDVSICNPPFHASLEEARSGTLRKLSNLSKEKTTEQIRNFGGRNNELWCKGGEEKFIRDMIRQSRLFSTSCFWYSSLVAKQSHLRNIYAALEKAAAVEVKTIPMGQGNKSSRIVAWTFLSRDKQEEWINTRWDLNL